MTLRILTDIYPPHIEPVFYVHLDGIRAMPPDIFAAWSPTAKQTAHEYRPVFDHPPPDELARLRAEVEALRADNKHLRGEFEKAWPDAERYRWLRNKAGRGAAGSIFDNFNGAAVDECIDAARAVQGGEHGR